MSTHSIANIYFSSWFCIRTEWILFCFWLSVHRLTSFRTLGSRSADGWKWKHFCYFNLLFRLEFSSVESIGQIKLVRRFGIFCFRFISSTRFLLSQSHFGSIEFDDLCDVFDCAISKIVNIGQNNRPIDRTENSFFFSFGGSVSQAPPRLPRSLTQWMLRNNCAPPQNWWFIIWTFRKTKTLEGLVCACRTIAITASSRRERKEEKD